MSRTSPYEPAFVAAATRALERNAEGISIRKAAELEGLKPDRMIGYCTVNDIPYVKIHNGAGASHGRRSGVPVVRDRVGRVRA